MIQVKCTIKILYVLNPRWICLAKTKSENYPYYIGYEKDNAATFKTHKDAEEAIAFLVKNNGLNPNLVDFIVLANEAHLC